MSGLIYMLGEAIARGLFFDGSRYPSCLPHAPAGVMPIWGIDAPDACGTSRVSSRSNESCRLACPRRASRLDMARPPAPRLRVRVPLAPRLALSLTYGWSYGCLTRAAGGTAA